MKTGAWGWGRGKARERLGRASQGWGLAEDYIEARIAVR